MSSESRVRNLKFLNVTVSIPVGAGLAPAQITPATNGRAASVQWRGSTRSGGGRRKN